MLQTIQQCSLCSLTTPLRLNLHEFSDQTLQAASTASIGCQLLARRHIVPLSRLQMIAVDSNGNIVYIYYIYTLCLFCMKLNKESISSTGYLKNCRIWRSQHHFIENCKSQLGKGIPRIVPWNTVARRVSQALGTKEYHHPHLATHLITQPCVPDTHARHWERPEYQIGPTWHQLWHFDTNLKFKILACQQFSTHTEAIILV